MGKNGSHDVGSHKAKSRGLGMSRLTSHDTAQFSEPGVLASLHPKVAITCSQAYLDTLNISQEVGYDQKVLEILRYHCDLRISQSIKLINANYLIQY